MNGGDRDCPAFRPGESRLPSPPRDPSSDRCPAVHCSLPRLMGCRRLTAMGRPRGPLSPTDEASLLAPGAPAGLTGRPRCSVPAKGHTAGDEQGLTARPIQLLVGGRNLRAFRLPNQPTAWESFAVDRGDAGRNVAVTRGRRGRPRRTRRVLSPRAGSRRRAGRGSRRRRRKRRASRRFPAGLRSPGTVRRG